jgi:hypothetical protein
MGTSDKRKPSRDEIEKKAYEIYERRGGQNGTDVEDWVEAERELNEPAREPVGVGSTGTKSKVTASGGGSRAEFERTLERLAKGRS